MEIIIIEPGSFDEDRQERLEKAYSLLAKEIIRVMDEQKNKEEV
ncbi:hypothetical protein [Natranaerofaba carboxydovora]|nr:hypothetical protein [Natranaerofaba carboxydovora]